MPVLKLLSNVSAFSLQWHICDVSIATHITKIPNTNETLILLIWKRNHNMSGHLSKEPIIENDDSFILKYITY